MKNNNWCLNKKAAGVYIHNKTKASMIVYVDEMLMLAVPKDVSGLWRELERSITFKDPEASLACHLGAHYAFQDFDLKNPEAPRSLSIDMGEFSANALSRFKTSTGQSCIASLRLTCRLRSMHKKASSLVFSQPTLQATSLRFCF